MAGSGGPHLTGAASSAGALLAMMVIGSVGLWVGVPLLWLYVASLVQGASDSVGAAMLTAFAGVAVSIVALVALLGWLSARHRALVIARGGRDPGTAPLELVLVASAVLAVAGLAVWFVGFSGSAPLPVPVPAG